MKKRSIKNRRFIAFILTLSMCFGLMGGILPSRIYAGAYAPELSNVFTTYYDGSQNKILDDWEEFAAVYAYLENQPGNDYATGVDIGDYALPSVGTGAGGVFTALMKGDKDTAAALADQLISGGIVADPGNIYTYAVQVLALEAYNRSTGVVPLVYSTAGAINHLLNAQDASGGYTDWSLPSYDNAGVVLAVLSLPTFAGYPFVSAERAALIEWMKSGQSATGAFASFGSDSANATACVLIGLSAAGEVLSDWTTSPAVGLINESLYTNADGWLSWNGSAWDAYATKQATLALAETESEQSFFVNIQLNATQYISATMQLVKPDGSFVEKTVTVPSGADLDSVASGVSGSAITGGLRYYENGSETTSIAEGSTVLAVADNFNSVVYFSFNGSGIGIPAANISFGSTANFILNEMTLSTGAIAVQAGIPIDTNGDSYGEFYSTATGQVDFSPVHSSTTLTPIASDYYGTYIAADAAILPSSVYMASGGVQTKTVSVRVEGPFDNIAHYSAYDVTGNGSSLLTAADAVTQALTSAGKSYTYSGGYLSMVDGVFAGSYDPSFYDGWVYYINGIPGGTMASQTIENGDEIVLYYGYYPGYGTDLASLHSSVSGNSVTLTVLGDTTPLSDVTIYWNGVGLPSKTDASGQIIIDNVVPGTYAVQLSKADDHGVPLIVRLASGSAITVTTDGSTGHSGGSGDTHTVSQVSLTIKGLDGNAMYVKTGQTYYVGITARDVLDASGLTILGNGNYISSINGLSEFDYGAGSGWLYMVNNALPGTTAANDYELDIDDQVLWYYTRNYTTDKNVKTSLDDLEEEVVEEVSSGSGIHFRDVPQGAWYQDAAESISALGIFNGVTEQEFGPELTMTREMFVTVLGRLFEKNHTIDSIAAVSFEDVGSGSYYAGYVAWAFKNGIVSGFDAGRFGTALPVTREQMAVFMYRFVGLLGLAKEEKSATLSGYNDAESVSDWAKTAVAWAVKNGLLKGKSAQMLEPGSNSSRAEVAIFTLRCFNYIHENTI